MILLPPFSVHLLFLRHDKLKRLLNVTHLQNSDLLPSKNLSNPSTLHHFPAKLLPLALPVPLPPTKGLNTSISLYNAVFLLDNYAPSSAVVHKQQSCHRHSLLDCHLVAFLIHNKYEAVVCSQLKKLRPLYVTIMFLWIQTTFETLNMTTSIKVRRSALHAASLFNVSFTLFITSNVLSSALLPAFSLTKTS